MALRTVNQLNAFCHECEVLRHILSRYTACENFNDMINELKCNDTLWAMADQNDMKESDMEEWVEAHMESFVECRVFQECGPAGGWPVISIKCLDKVFYLDWVLD